MLDLSQNGYTYKEVKNRLISNCKIKFEYDLLDKSEKKIGTLDNVECSISFESEAEIKKSANIIVNEREYKNIDFLNERIRPVFCLEMDQQWIKWNQGIFLLSSPERVEKDGDIYRDIEAYDGLLVLKEDKVDNRYLIKAGSFYTEEIRELILSSGITKISIQESSLALSVDKEYEIGTSKLKIINDLLLSINYYSLFVDNNGFYTARKYTDPQKREYEFEYLTDKNSITTYGSSEVLDLFGVPNKFVRYVENPESGYLISTFINDKASNKLSTVSRGRNITDIASVNDIADQETLDEYVKRIANEKSQVFGGYRFSSLIMPHHTFLDCLRVRNDELGISEKVIETAWSMDLKVDALMQHTCKKVVELW